MDLKYDKEYSGTASMSYFDDDDESLNFDLDGTFEESNMQGTFYFKGNAPYPYLNKVVIPQKLGYATSGCYHYVQINL